MRSLKSWAKTYWMVLAIFTLMVAVGWLLGFVVAQNWDRNGFFEVKFHELIGTIGTMGALLAATYAIMRDHSWRTSDKASMAEASWLTVERNVLYFKHGVDLVHMFMQDAETFGGPFNANYVEKRIKRFLGNGEELKSNVPMMHNLPPSMSRPLLSAVSMFESLSEDLARLSTVQLGGEIRDAITGNVIRQCEEILGLLDKVDSEVAIRKSDGWA